MRQRAAEEDTQHPPPVSMHAHTGSHTDVVRGHNLQRGHCGVHSHPFHSACLYKEDGYPQKKTSGFRFLALFLSWEVILKDASCFPNTSILNLLAVEVRSFEGSLNYWDFGTIGEDEKRTWRKSSTLIWKLPCSFLNANLKAKLTGICWALSECPECGDSRGPVCFATYDHQAPALVLKVSVNSGDEKTAVTLGMPAWPDPSQCHKCKPNCSVFQEHKPGINWQGHII